MCRAPVNLGVLGFATGALHLTGLCAPDRCLATEALPRFPDEPGPLDFLSATQ
ncbi:hypothetical protein [Tropicibacter alexandrii]|uniref:hypothetical protein n=1 Tax=Tropicibacter alexandrii TaxID=2267683 RepID=UPI0013E8D033|nr:hypothetical protein [Tropicibacter alexandrii]